LAGAAASVLAASAASYYCDELGRLIATVAADDTSVLYNYDAVGNITSVKHESASSMGINGFTSVLGSTGTVGFSSL
jgi:YD repeat-containing protein